MKSENTLTTILCLEDDYSEARDIAIKSHNQILVVKFIEFPDGELEIIPSSQKRLGTLVIFARLTATESCKWLKIGMINSYARTVSSNVHIIIPYLPYARREGMNNLVVEIINRGDKSRLSCIDVHKVVSGVFNLDFSEEIAQVIMTHSIDAVISPDKGSEQRAGRVALLLGKPLFVMTKSRVGSLVETTLGAANLPDRVLLIDDMISTGDTIISALRLAHAKGAKFAMVFVTHALKELPLIDIPNGLVVEWISTDSIARGRGSILVSDIVADRL